MYVKWSNLTRNAKKILSKICHIWPHTYKLGKGQSFTIELDYWLLTIISPNNIGNQ